MQPCDWLKDNHNLHFQMMLLRKCESAIQSYHRAVFHLYIKP